MATCLFLLAWHHAKSAVIIRNAASYVMNLAHLVLRIVPNDRKGETNGSKTSAIVELSINREDCKMLVKESRSRNQTENIFEGLLYWARFLPLERSFAEHGSDLTLLLDKAREHILLANKICDKNPGQTAGTRNEVEDVEKMLRDSRFYLPVRNKEKAAVYAGMARDFRGTGQWYYCEYGHPFIIGECGIPMQISQCPQCGAPVGGRNH